MKRNVFSLPLLLVVAVFALNSCSGPLGGGCTSNCGGGGGTGNVIVTVTSTPSQTFFFVNLEWSILSIDLISSGGPVNVVSGSLPPVEFARLQTDSQFLGRNLSNIPAATYTSAKIQIAPSTTPSYFFNSTGAALFGCAAGAVCKIPSSVPGFGAVTVTVPVTFTVGANSNTGFSLNFDLSKAVTTAGGMTFDFTKAGAITLTTLPRAGQNPAGLDSFQNFTGAVTAKTATTFDMASLSSDTRTFNLAANVEFDDPFSICPPPASFSCLAVNQNVSVDAFINSDGTLSVYEVDFLDKSPGPLENEGIIVTPVSGGQFQMVVTNSTSITSGFFPGTLVTVKVSGTSTYAVDPKNLGVSSTPVGFQSSTDLVVGQSVMLQGGTADFTTTPNTLSGYNRTLLRYSSIGGTVTTPSGTIFTLSGVSPFFTNLSTNSVSVQTFPNTTYDNITGGFTGLTGVTNASVRGLYLNPNSGVTQPLLAAQVRAH